MTDDIDGEPADNLPFESPDPYGVGEDEDSESGQPGNTGSDSGRADRPRHGDNRGRDSKAFVDIGGDVWVDITAITVIQRRTLDGDPLKRVPGCTVFLAGDPEPVHGEDNVNTVLKRIAAAGY